MGKSLHSALKLAGVGPVTSTNEGLRFTPRFRRIYKAGASDVGVREVSGREFMCVRFEYLWVTEGYRIRCATQRTGRAENKPQQECGL